MKFMVSWANSLTPNIQGQFSKCTCFPTYFYNFIIIYNFRNLLLQLEWKYVQSAFSWKLKLQPNWSKMILQMDINYKKFNDKNNNQFIDIFDSSLRFVSCEIRQYIERSNIIIQYMCFLRFCRQPAAELNSAYERNLCFSNQVVNTRMREVMKR